MFTLEVGSKVKLEIRKQGINGEGIGYYNKLAIFVPGAILKEEVNCEITEANKTYAVAKLDEIVRPSTKRILPPCRFFEQCGGCQMQHIEYKEQLKIKRSIIAQALARYTDVYSSNKILKKTLGMKDTFCYRNKSQMPFKNTTFCLALGLYATQSNHFVYIDECMTQSKKVNEINQDALSVLRKHKMMANDSMNPEGVLLNLVTRHLETTDTASVTFIVTKYDPTLEVVAKELIKKNQSIDSVTYSVNQKSNPMMFGKTVKLLQKNKFIQDQFKEMQINISPDAFHQLNSKQMIILYDEIEKAAELTGKEIVIDAYSGIGITSMLLAKKAKKVYGIDYSEASILDATKNALQNKISNVQFIEDHVEGALPKLIASGVVPDLLVLDPPRAGLHETVIKQIISSKIKRVIYVSCNPSTLAKNLSILSKQYNVEYIQPIDMFPHTASVESLTLLTLKP